MALARYPSLAIRFTIAGRTSQVDALIDTGFDGYLALPAQLIPELPRAALRRRVQTASGQVVFVPVFRANIEFMEIPGPFDALAIALGDEFLIGLQAINRIRLTLDHGERVIIQA